MLKDLQGDKDKSKHASRLITASLEIWESGTLQPHTFLTLLKNNTARKQKQRQDVCIRLRSTRQLLTEHAMLAAFNVQRQEGQSISIQQHHRRDH